MGHFGVTFTAPQGILFSGDVERASAFDRRLGFQETFRVPDKGPPIHAWVQDPDGDPVQLVQRLSG